MTHDKAMIKVLLDLQADFDILERNHKRLQSEHNILKNRYTTTINEAIDYQFMIAELKKQLKVAREWKN